MSHASSSDGGMTIGSQRIGRRSLLGGLAAVGAVAAVTGAVTIASDTPAFAEQSGWRWCGRCQGLWFPLSENPTCPSPSNDGRRGRHTGESSGNYTLYKIGEGGNQHEWRWCFYCAGLWFSGNGTNGYCAGSVPGHSMWNSGNYQLSVNGSSFDNPAPGQGGWFWCFQCQGLWYGLNFDSGHCPIAPGAAHSRVNSGFYYLPKS